MSEDEWHAPPRCVVAWTGKLLGRHSAEFGDSVPISRGGFLREHFVQRVEFRVRESIGAVEVDFLPGTMKSLRTDFQTGERRKRGLRRSVLQERDGEPGRVYRFFLEERITREDG